MRKLTQREKILVYIAAVLLLLTGGYYLVEQPAEMRRGKGEKGLKKPHALGRGNEERPYGEKALGGEK